MEATGDVVPTEDRPIATRQTHLQSTEMINEETSASPPPKHDGGAIVEPSKIPFWQLVIYFVLGLSLHLFGLIPVLLWLRFKVKRVWGSALMWYMAGMVTLLLYYLIVQFVLAPLLESWMVKQFPILGYVREEMAVYYPDQEIGVNVNYEGSWENGVETNTKTVVVTLEGAERLTTEDFKEAGVRACDILESHDESVDFLGISSTATKRLFAVIPLNTYVTATMSCDEWRTGGIYSLPELPLGL